MAERGAQNGPSHINELKVSGHTMTLEPGLYCVFNAPGGPVQAADSGLPGVRITPAPGRAASLVTVAGFQGDGWIGSDSAALVRVSSQAAEVLVTVYQASDSTGAAPQLQVVRLSGEAAAGAPSADAKAAATKRAPVPEKVEVVAHVYARGDVAGQLGDWIGEPGSNRWIEGFGIAPVEGGVPLPDLEYQAVLGRGWLSPWSEGGQFCGSRGMSLPILGLRVRLRGASAATHRVALSASFVDGTRLGPVHDGEPCEAPSLAALEAFQVTITEIGGQAATKAPAKSAARAEAKPSAKAQPAVRGKAPAAAPPAKASTVGKAAVAKAQPSKGKKQPEAAATAKGKAVPSPAKPAAPAARTPARRTSPGSRRR